MTFVPVNDISPINQYTATGGQTDFVFSFVIYETANIGVYVNGDLKTETTDYIVKKSDGSSVLAADLADGLSGGIVVFNSGLALDDEVSLNRDIPVERVSGFTTSGAFDSAVINKELNVITAVQQELELGIERALILPDSDTAALPFELPSKTSRSSKYLAFDAEGQPIAAAGTAGAADVTITSFAETLLDDGNATTMLSTLGFSAYAKTLIDDADAATARGTLEAQEDVITTRGDVIRGGSSDVAERLALGTSGYSLQSDGIDVVWQEIPLPKGYINGLTIANNGSDPEHDIDIAVGDCRDFANTKNIKLTSAITKQIDANWAEGAAAGGFPSSLTLSNTTWYRVFVILKSDGTIDAGYDTSATAANLLSDATGYAEYRQVGWVLTDGSANIEAFQGEGDSLIWDVQSRDHSGTIATSRTGVTVKAPPNTLPLSYVHWNYNPGTAAYLIATSLDQTDTTPSSSSFSILVDQTSTQPSEGGPYKIPFRCNSSSQIGLRATAASGSVRVFTTGFVYVR